MLSGRATWLWRFTLDHIFREANSVANCLAQMASSSHTSSSFHFFDLPAYIRGLLALDRVNFPYFWYQISLSS